jgi:hypothetical protein
MDDKEAASVAAAMDDVALVRLLTREAPGTPAPLLAAAEAEARRRGVPIDEAFIPAEDDALSGAADAVAVRPDGAPAEPPDARATPRAYRVAASRVRCAHCAGERFTMRDASLRDFALGVMSVATWRVAALRCERCGAVALFDGSPQDDGP